MPLDDIPNLKERSAVTNNPFVINDEPKLKKSSSLMNLSPDQPLKTNPFIKHDQEQKQDRLKRAVSLKSKKQESMLDLLRNFDQTEKQERIVYQSKPPLNKKIPVESKKPVLNSEIVYEEGGSVLDRLKKFTNMSIKGETGQKSEPSPSQCDAKGGAAKENVESPIGQTNGISDSHITVPEANTLLKKESNGELAKQKPELLISKRSGNSDSESKDTKQMPASLVSQTNLKPVANCEIVHEQNGSIKDRLNKYNSSLQNDERKPVVSKSIDVKEIIKIESKAKSLKEKNSEIVYEEGGSLFDRRSKFLNDTNPRIPIASFSTPITKSILQPKKQFETKQEYKVELESNDGKQIVEYADCLKEDSFEDGHLCKDPVYQEKPKTTLDLDIPEISLGSIFEEKDQWITNLWGFSNVKPEPVNEDAVSDSSACDEEFNTSQEQIDNFIDSYDSQEPEKEPQVDHVLDTSKSSETLRLSAEEIPITKQIEKKMKKSVSFASAWKGDLENTRVVCSDPVYFDQVDQSVGRLLVKITNIHDVFIAAEYDRVVDLEICQGVICQTSPPYTLKQNQTSLAIDWETQLSIVPNSPIHFRIKVRQVCPPEGLKRSRSKQTIGSGIKQMSSKLLTKFSQTNLANSESFSSISSESSTNFKKEPLFGSVQNMRTGHFMICNVGEWTTEMSQQISTTVFELFEIDFSKPKLFSFKKTDNVISIGKITSQVLFMKSIADGNELLPISISEYKDDLQTISLHSKVWKEGQLSQLGGDCADWKSRHFRLSGTFLIGCHETTLEEKVKICLGQLEAIKFNDKDNAFSLEFRDGEIIKFQCRDEMERKHEWIEAIEDSQNILADNPLPAWAQ